LFNVSLQQQLSQAQNTLKASSCVLYVRDPEFPGEFRLIAFSEVGFEDPMFGFVYTESAQQPLDGEGEIFRTYSDAEKTQPTDNPLVKRWRGLMGRPDETSVGYSGPRKFRV